MSLQTSFKNRECKDDDDDDDEKVVGNHKSR
jgi:hypothetical protein